MLVFTKPALEEHTCMLMCITEMSAPETQQAHEVIYVQVGTVFHLMQLLQALGVCYTVPDRFQTTWFIIRDCLIISNEALSQPSYSMLS
jgi:hypothetical protein